MRHALLAILCFATIAAGCSRSSSSHATAEAHTGARPEPAGAVAGGYRGFDRNDYPGNGTMFGLRRHFAFTSYWLTPPPDATTTTWLGKREVLKQQGWGFLVLVNGKLEAEILKSQKAGTAPADLGRSDAATAIAAAKSEAFPSGTILFLDQEEGGRLTAPQSAYLLAWTETVAASAYKPGLYASGQPVPDGPGATITTIHDVREQISSKHLHPVAIFDYQDQCPPAPGCTLAAKPITTAGEPDLIAWQYAQSPRRPEITQSCAATYAADNNCYAPGFTKIFLDMDLATSPDPSHGR